MSKCLFVKRAVSMLLAGAMLCGLTGCNRNETVDTGSSDSQNEQSSGRSQSSYGTSFKSELPEEQNNNSAISVSSVYGNDTSSNTPVSDPDNWYVEGYEIPDNWLPVMMSTEVFEHYDEIFSETRSDKAIDVTIQNLMNRNVIAFEILYGREPAYMLADSTNSSFGTQNASDICPIRSDYFDSLDDVAEIMNGTYTKALSKERLNGSAGDRKLFLEKDGVLCVDLDNMYYWSSDPFKSKTYIEISDANENTCSFNWHYIEWGLWDNEGNDTDKLYPHHRQKMCKAVVEDGKWKLTSIVFDNMA